MRPRVGAATAFDAATDKVVVFGGVGARRRAPWTTPSCSARLPQSHCRRHRERIPLLHVVHASHPTRGRDRPGSAAKTGVAAPPSTSLLPAPAGLSPPHPSVSPVHTLHRGDLVTLTGSGFANGASVTIWFYSQPVVVGRAWADRLGHFTATVPVPDSASPGTHRFEASGEGPTGPISEVIATVKIVDVPDSAQTSSTMQRLLLTAIALLIPGATWLALVATGRLRRRRSALP